MQMVNAGFPDRTRMVSKWWMPPRIGLWAENRRQLKIYTESNHSGFSQIFGDLSAMQILAVYRRLLVRD
jgi:hypothetical protein